MVERGALMQSLTGVLSPMATGPGSVERPQQQTGSVNGDEMPLDSSSGQGMHGTNVAGSPVDAEASIGTPTGVSPAGLNVPSSLLHLLQPSVPVWPQGAVSTASRATFEGSFSAAAWQETDPLPGQMEAIATNTRTGSLSSSNLVAALNELSSSVGKAAAADPMSAIERDAADATVASDAVKSQDALQSSRSDFSTSIPSTPPSTLPPSLPSSAIPSNASNAVTPSTNPSSPALTAPSASAGQPGTEDIPLAYRRKTRVPKVHRCTDCDAVFAKSHGLRRHQRTTHSANRPFSCPMCRTRFKRRDSMRKHMSCVCPMRAGAGGASGDAVTREGPGVVGGNGGDGAVDVSLKPATPSGEHAPPNAGPSASSTLFGVADTLHWNDLGYGGAWMESILPEGLEDWEEEDVEEEGGMDEDEEDGSDGAAIKKAVIDYCHSERVSELSDDESA
ncbi:hypothetical protein HDU96_007185 [Phlyctochytrium bullatum]|nr:hypothetical protein HDU96_007185 [Phlyctochytrium bullatum]